jgi:hypothetical protein
MGLKVKDPNGEWRSTGGGGGNLDILESEVTETDIIPAQDVALSYNSSLGACMKGDYNLFSIVLGETYEVVWGDQTFTCTAFDGVLDGAPCVAIGNPYPVGGADNNLPFIIGIVPLDADVVLSVIAALGDITSVKVRVYQSKTVERLKMAYIPNALYTEIDKRIEAYINDALGGEF